jgi:hypothetical protein
MQTAITFISENKNWLFSGLGVSAIFFIVKILLRKKNDQPSAAASNQNTVNQTVIVNPAQVGKESPITAPDKSDELRNGLKLSKHVLFIDDDSEFKIVSMLRKSGWKNVDIISDVKRIDQDKVKTADIIFIDIQGVGKAMEFQKEGLGLLKALKETYPNKKLVVYSAVAAHDIFAEELEWADAKLRKTTELYEFQSTIINLLS